jgi:hypothetical protein
VDAKIRFLSTEDHEKIGRDGNQMFALRDHLKSAVRQGTDTDLLPRLSSASDGTGGQRAGIVWSMTLRVCITAMSLCPTHGQPRPR